MMKEYRPIEQDPLVSAEPIAAYDSSNTVLNAVKRMSRQELESECYSLEESKARLLDLINRHFQNQ